MLLQGNANRSAPEMLCGSDRGKVTPRETAVARPAERQPGQGTEIMKQMLSQEHQEKTRTVQTLVFLPTNADDRSRKYCTLATAGPIASVSGSSMALVECACRGGAAHGACLSGSPDGIQRAPSSNAV